MANSSDEDYAALQERLLDPAQAVPSAGQVASGPAAADIGRAFLVREYGSQEAVEREIARGRPRLGQRSGASPTVRGRVAAADYAALKQLEQRTGRTQSELVREAVHRLLVEHNLAG